MTHLQVLAEGGDTPVGVGGALPTTGKQSVPATYVVPSYKVAWTLN